MRRTLLLLIVTFLTISGYAQTTVEVNKLTLTYKDTLQLDFYSPKKSSEAASPLLLLMHGGGFAMGKRDGAEESRFCTTMAQKGYTVASISYRLTRLNDPLSCDCATDKKVKTFVGGAEDLADALVFLSDKKSLKFNRNKIILIGSSAGAETVLHLAYMNDDYRFKHINSVKVAGLVSFSGAMMNASYISQSNAVPTLFIHGKKDQLVPYGTAAHHFCSQDKAGYLMLDGPETMAKKLKNLRTSYHLAYDPKGNHDWANMAYRETDLIHNFIDNIVLEKKASNLTFKSKKLKLQQKDLQD